MNLVYNSNAVVEVTKEFTFDSARFIDNDIFMIRLPHTDTGLVKCFVWNSIESMMPLDINIGI